MAMDLCSTLTDLKVAATLGMPRMNVRNMLKKSITRKTLKYEQSSSQVVLEALEIPSLMQLQSVKLVLPKRKRLILSFLNASYI